MRKTKIICTLGPASEKTETLRQMITRGADVFRLNMSHAEPAWAREIVPRIRKLADEVERPVGILLDTQGPAIRTGDLKTDLRLKPGDIIELTVRGAKSKERYSVSVNYDGVGLWRAQVLVSAQHEGRLRLHPDAPPGGRAGCRFALARCPDAPSPGLHTGSDDLGRGPGRPGQAFRPHAGRHGAVTRREVDTGHDRSLRK